MKFTMKMKTFHIKFVFFVYLNNEFWIYWMVSCGRYGYFGQTVHLDKIEFKCCFVHLDLAL